MTLVEFREVVFVSVEENVGIAVAVTIEAFVELLTELFVSGWSVAVVFVVLVAMVDSSSVISVRARVGCSVAVVLVVLVALVDSSSIISVGTRVGCGVAVTLVVLVALADSSLIISVGARVGWVSTVGLVVFVALVDFLLGLVPVLVAVVTACSE